MSSESYLRDNFRVSVGRKTRDYRVQIDKSELELKPLDTTSGKIVVLKANKIVSCQEVQDDRNSLFKVVYCHSKDSLETKTYVFAKCENQLGSVEDGNVSANWSETINAKFDLFPVEKFKSRKILVIANPKAGKGNALRTFRQLERLLSETTLSNSYTTLTSTHRGHVEEFFAKDKSVPQLGGVLVLSGDGIVYEIINGIYQREDWKYLLQTISLGIVPVGSGNSLAFSLIQLQRKKDQNVLLQSLMNTLGGRPIPLDLFSISMSNNSRRVGFLSIGWGIIADVDIESERLRSLGELRFNLWGMYKIANLKKYRGRISYLKAGPLYGEGLKFVDDDEDETDGVRRVDENGEEQTRSKIPESLEEEIPSDWTVEEDDFICVYVVNLPQLDSKTLLAPDCTPNDGFMWLFIIRKEATKSDLLKIMHSFDDGSHVKLNHVDVIKIKAIRLEPLNLKDKGHLTLDGELVEYGAIQASCLPSAARVMLK